MGLGFFRPTKKQKNTLKIGVFFVSLFLGMNVVAQTPEVAEDPEQNLALIPEAAIEEAAPVELEDLVVIPTLTVQPLQIIVNDPEPGLPFSGEILSRRYFKADKVTFYLYNDDGLVEWEDHIELRGEEERVVPFYFPDVQAKGDLRLVVKAEGADTETVAMGERPVSFPYGTETTKLVSALATLEEDNSARVEIELKGGAFNETFIPYVRIYKEQRTTESIYTEHEDLPVKISPQATRKVAFKIDNFLPTGVYVLDIGLKNFKTKEFIEGYFTETIFSPGDYVRINEIKVALSKDEEKKVDVGLRGLAFLGNAGLIGSNITVFDGDQKITQKSGQIDLDNGYFSHTLKFGLEEIRPDFRGEITLRSPGGEVLATQEFTFSTLEASLFDGLRDPSNVAETPVVETPVVPVQTNSGNPVQMILGWAKSNIEIVGGAGIGLVFLILACVFFARRRHQIWWLTFGSSALVAPWLAFSYELPFYPTVEWVQPNITALSAYNPDSTEGFAVMAVEGRLYNGLTGQGFFDQDVIKEWRINFIDDQGKNYQFSLKDNYYAEDTDRFENVATGYYRFNLDLAKFEGKFPLGESREFFFVEGNWRTQLLFRFYDDNKAAHTWYATDYSEDLSRFIIDRTPPKLEVNFLDPTGKELDGESFTNTPVTLKLACADEFSECLWGQKQIEVKGNFCADGTLCDNRAAREILVCDLAQNCVTEEIQIDYYDPIPPSLEFFNINGSLLERAEAEYELNLRSEDPRRVTDEEGKELFQEHLCSNESSGYFLNKINNRCYPKRYPCVFKDDDRFVRGHDTGKGCTQACPEGFEYQNGSCQVPCNNQSFVSGKMCFPFIFTP